jgi:F-type H+-transporting ATPase subunit b
MNAVLDALHNLGFDWHVALANLVNFLIIFYILKRFFFGGIAKTLSDRKEKIDKGLSDAKEAKEALEGASLQKESIVKDAHTKASQILSETEQKAKNLSANLEEEGKQKAQAILDDVVKKEALIKQEHERELNQKVPMLAASAVEKILMEKMSAEENKKFVDKLLA